MAGLELPEMALFRRPTYGTPSSERARPNGGGRRPVVILNFTVYLKNIQVGKHETFSEGERLCYDTDGGRTSGADGKEPRL